MKRSKLFTGMLACTMLTTMILVVGCGDDDDGPTAPDPSVHQDLVTEWRAVSVTVDGLNTNLADFFEFSQGTVAFHLTIDADTSYRGEELDSLTEPANVVTYEEGTAVSSGQTLTLTLTGEDGVALPDPEVVAVGTWEVDGTRMFFTMEDEGRTIVITWSNWRT